MPIGAIAQSAALQVQKDYDLLFYGDYKSNPRRRRFLEGLGGHYRTKLVDDAFRLRNSFADKENRNIVLNLQYHCCRRRIAEMPRIQECLFLSGTPVIFLEAAKDASEYPCLTDAVTFFEEGSVTRI